MASENVLELNDTDFKSTIGEGVTLVDFWATWCGPCRMLTPIIGKVATTLDGKAKVAKVNIDEAPSTTEEFGITAVPTIIVFKDGVEVDRISGVQPENAIVAKVEAQL